MERPLNFTKWMPLAGAGKIFTSAWSEAPVETKEITDELLEATLLRERQSVLMRCVLTVTGVPLGKRRLQEKPRSQRLLRRWNISCVPMVSTECPRSARKK